MHRQPILTALADYRSRYREEADVVDRFEAFVREEPNCFRNDCWSGHITGSSWLLDGAGSRALLTHHKKLGKWLQLGGHVDGEPEVWRAALREAREESGLQRFRVSERPLDLDIHPIPAHGDEPEHLHLDVRFLLRVEPGQELVRSHESLDLRWFPVDELPSVTAEESVLRLQRKAELVLRAGLGR